MSAGRYPTTTATDDQVRTEKTFPRFTLVQRWEHGLLILTFVVLFLTGVVQKFRHTIWSQQILATPERLELIQTIHRVAAVVITLEALYHLGRGLVLLARRRLSGAIFLSWQDIRDAVQMFRYVLFLTDRRPRYGKYSFEQKYTYWFMVFGLGIMIVTGFILWFPVLFTRIFPGGIVPAAKLAHSTEAVVGAVFVVLWHFYHVHVERLNLSIFTGRLNEEEMRTYHALEFERLEGQASEDTERGEPA